MRRLIVPLILSMSAAALMLAGCTFTAGAGPTSSAKSVAATAEKALEKKVGIKPDIDCGTKDIAIVEGTSVTCELTDPTTDEVFDVTITFTKVDGADYHLDAKVADTPKS